MLEVTFGVETSGHYSKVKRGKKTQVITFCFGSLSSSQAWELAILGFLSLWFTVNNVLPCFSITWKNKGCFLSNFLALNLSLGGITTEVGKLIGFLFIIMSMSLQSISKMSQIEFLLNLTFQWSVFL